MGKESEDSEEIALLRKRLRSRGRCIAGCEDFKSLHRVPTRIEEANLWFNLLGRQDLLYVRNPGHYRVCNRHFSEKMRGTSGVRLYIWALPDTNLPDNSVPPPGIRPVIEVNQDESIEENGKLDTQSSDSMNTLSIVSPKRTILSPPLQTTSVVNSVFVRSNNVHLPTTQANTLPQIINQLSVDNPPSAEVVLQIFQRELAKKLLVNESKIEESTDDNVIDIPQHLIVKLVFSLRGENLPPENASSSSENSILTQFVEVPMKDKRKVTNKYTQCRLDRDNNKRKEEKEPIVPIKVDKSTSYEEYDEEFEELMQIELPEIKGFRYIEDGKCECLFCGKQFEASSYAKTHLQMHQEKSRLCYRCGKVFESYIKCYNHERVCALESENEGERKPRKSSSYVSTAAERVCGYCGRYSNSLIKHLDHLNSHTGARPHKCSCGAGFKNLPNFYTHRKRFGCKNAPAEIPYGVRMRALKKDGDEVRSKKKEKKNKEGRRRTRWSASDPDRYVCKVCGHRNKDYTSYRSHNRKHITERKYVCQVCNNSYKDPIALRSHIRNVHLEKSKCKYCGRLCTPYYMRIHLRRHTGERPFGCNLCDQKFISKIALRVHKSTVHNVGEVNVPCERKATYRCSMCGDVFASKRAIENHLAKPAHLEKEYRWKESLGLTFFTCAYCNSSFEDFGKYAAHMGSSHCIHVFRKMEETLKQFEQAPPHTFLYNGGNEEDIIEENTSEMIEEYIDEVEFIKAEHEDDICGSNGGQVEIIETYEPDIQEMKDEEIEEICVIKSEDQIVASEEVISVEDHMIEFLNFQKLKDLHIEFLEEDNVEHYEPQK